MAENPKNPVKKNFFQRNFLFIIIILIIGAGLGYLYQNNLLTFQIPTKSSPIVEPTPSTPAVVAEDVQNNQLQEKVDRLENLIIELAQSVENIPQQEIIIPPQEPTPIEISNSEAYELILNINQIIINIDNQQIRNKHIQKLQSQYSFFQESKLEELLTLPDSSFLAQDLIASEKDYVENEFLNSARLAWLKKILANLFDVSVAKNNSSALSNYFNSIMNRNYDLALVAFDNLTSNQKSYFKSSYEIAKKFNENKIFLENMI